MDLSAYQAVLLDLDGTIYFEDRALPGAIELIRQLQSAGQKYACLSNSTTSPARIVTRLLAMGVTIDPASIYTAAAAAVDYALSHYSAGRKPRIFNLATEGVQEMLEGRVDFVPLDWAALDSSSDSIACDAVIAGAPANFYAKEDRQRFALRLLKKGATLIGICADRVYPSPRGLEIGSGAFAHMLAYAANINPIFCGKPQRSFFETLCRRLDVNPARCLLIGDNLESDVVGAKAVGMQTILTLTGVARPSDLLNAPAQWQPDFVVEDLRELLR
jgi:HAD superfamily hydrolase (TIGR01450 family)